MDVGIGVGPAVGAAEGTVIFRRKIGLKKNRNEMKTRMKGTNLECK